LNGGDGSDQLYGDDGNDVLSGGAGNDNLTGGLGNDTLTGGADSDFFDVWSVFGDTSTDTITDFTAGNGIARRPALDSHLAVQRLHGGQSLRKWLRPLDAVGQQYLAGVRHRWSGRGAAAFQTAVILNNVNKSDLVANNLNGYNPNAIVGTAGEDSLNGTRW
jgi:hypothetical protein